jgi:hypothetical protein
MFSHLISGIFILYWDLLDRISTCVVCGCALIGLVLAYDLICLSLVPFCTYIESVHTFESIF